MAVSPEHPSQQEFSDYLDEQLAPVERARVQAHLSDCAICSASYAQLVATIRMLRQLPALSPPREFRIGPRVARPTLATRLYPWTRALTGIAAALVVVLFTLDLAVLGPAAPTASAPAASAGRAATQLPPTVGQAPVVAQAPASAPTAAGLTVSSQPTSVASPTAQTFAKAPPSPTVAEVAASESAPQPPPAAAVAAAPRGAGTEPDAAAGGAAAAPEEDEQADAATAAEPTVAEVAVQPTVEPTVIVRTAGTPSPLPTLTPTTPPVEPTVAAVVVTNARPAQARTTLWPWTLVALVLALVLGAATLILRRQAHLSRS